MVQKDVILDALGYYEIVNQHNITKKEEIMLQKRSEILLKMVIKKLEAKKNEL